VSYLLLEAGLFPTAAIGGILRNIDNNAYFGDGQFFVAEADESDGSFLCYQPKYSIITNIDYEHLDYYKDFKNEIDTFKRFLLKTEKDGCAFCSGDDLNLRNIIKDYKNRYVLFGLKDGADIYPRNIEFEGLSSEFDCFYKNKFIDRFSLALGGEHNISNALAVIALGIELRIDLGVIKKTLANYKGAQRRLEVKFSGKQHLLIDDYAHHPTEIKATLRAVKNLNPQRVVAIFQPHRYTRTKLLLDEFGNSFDAADYIVITDIYPAGESPIDGISGRRIYEKIKERLPEKEVHFLPKEEITGHILEIIKTGDLVITLGAGDIIKVCDELVERIEGKD
jgi:UDP-N-acetylmuramate--alanine ligase